MEVIRHRFYCRICKTGKPDIKLVLCKKYNIQYYACNKCNTDRILAYRKTKNGAFRSRIAVYKSIKAHPEKQKARLKVREALLNNILIKPKKCSNCKLLKTIEGHHPDYSKPLEVVWLCRSCHSILHK